MKRHIWTLVLTIFPFMTQAITTTVPVGSIVDNGDVNSVVTQKVYGQTNNFTVSGVQQIMSGGSSYNSNLYPYGQQDVMSGGISYNTNIQYYALQNVYGKSYSSSIDTRGSMNINKGGYAEGTIINGGTLYVLTGGTSVNSQIISGKQYVSGTDTGTILTSGLQEVKSGGVTSNTTIEGGTQQIDEGGKSENTTINGGSVKIFGSTNGATVNSNGVLNILSDGFAQNTIINGGRMEVNSSGTSKYTNLISGQQRVYGLDSYGTISGGTQSIRSGGRAQYATVSGQGVQQISGSGIAQNSTITDGGTQLITNGTATDTIITNGGIQQIEGGISENSQISNNGKQLITEGTALETVLNSGGIQQIDDGASSNTIINSGGQQIINGGFVTDTSINSGGIQLINNGTVSGSIVESGGEQRINGGTIENTQVGNGGKQIIFGGNVTGTEVYDKGIQQINSNGMANSSHISNQGIQIINGGQAYDTILSTGGSQQISDGGAAYNTEISEHGIQYVDNNGTSYNSVIKSQGIEQIIYGGTAIDSQVYTNGLLTIGNGGIAQNSIIYEKGAIWIYNGGTAENTVIDNGGWMTLNSGGILSGQTRINNGNLTIIGSNEISDLTLTNTMVYLTPAPQFSQLTINNLNGSGRFYISSNIAANKSDQIIVQSGNGDFGLVVHDYSNSTQFPDRFSIINERNGAQDQFYLVGGAVNVGAYEYSLEEQDGDWYLVKTQELNDSSYVSKNAFFSLPSIFETHIMSLYSQLESIRNQKRNDNGLWIRNFGRRIKDKFKDNTATHTDIFGTQIGYNHTIWNKGDDVIDIGIYGGYSFSRQKYSIDGKGTGYTNNLGIYATYGNQSHYFIDIFGSYFWHHQKTTDYTPDGTDVIAKYNPHGWQTSFIAGKRFIFANNWYIEPQIGIDYLRIDGVKYQTNFNTPVKTSNYDTLKSGIGFYLGKDIMIFDEIDTQIYSRFKIVNYSDAKAWIAFSDYTFIEKISSTGYELGFGINMEVKNNWTSYIDAGTRFGGKSTVPLEMSFGLQYNF